MIYEHCSSLIFQFTCAKGCPSSVCPSVRPFTPLNDFSSETPGPNFFKFYVEPCVKGGLNNCKNAHGS